MKKVILISVMTLFFSDCRKGGEECQEKIKENCICTKEYNPVCGCNNKTYGNPCMAECSGIAKYTMGACK